MLPNFSDQDSKSQESETGEFLGEYLKGTRQKVMTRKKTDIFKLQKENERYENLKFEIVDYVSSAFKANHSNQNNDNFVASFQAQWNSKT